MEVEAAEAAATTPAEAAVAGLVNYTLLESHPVLCLLFHSEAGASVVEILDMVGMVPLPAFLAD